MDPQACWDEIVQLLKEYPQYAQDTLAQEGIREELSWALHGLAEWIDKGGFLPRVKE